MTGVIHFTPCVRTTLASAKIALFIRDATKATLIENKMSDFTQCYDILFVVNSPFGFCEFRDGAVQLSKNAKKVIWVQNDYAIEIPSKLKPYIKEVWSSVQTNDYKYINWNMLTYNPEGYVSSVKKLNGLCYWGAFRKDRVMDFKKYFTPSLYPVHVSTSVNNRLNFLSIDKNIHVYPPLSAGQFSLFGATVYIEDLKSHTTFCSLANRFYEALSHKMFIMVDKRCIGTFQKSGLDLPAEYVVDSSRDIKALFDHCDIESAVLWQQKHWVRDYNIELINAFNTMYKGIL